MNKVLDEVKFTDRKSALQQKLHLQNINVTQKQYFTEQVQWHLIENHPLLREKYREPPLISYRRGKSLKDYLPSRPVASIEVTAEAVAWVNICYRFVVQKK